MITNLTTACLYDVAKLISCIFEQSEDTKYIKFVSEMQIQDTDTLKYLDTFAKIHFLYLKYISRYLYLRYYPALLTNLTLFILSTV